MWISEIVELKRQRQMAGPVRHGHLQVLEGGKIEEGVYARPISLWKRISSFLARRRPSVRFYKISPEQLPLGRTQGTLEQFTP